ncbi:MFS transporter [Teichococcus vastitatis]|uniref:MFS transporter n=1 Tax=Teichococcus vastitatis TaxID=2307076 RepID=A0ABS9WA69_9PROT|nr:MFS transporter [Pseudoroseomonas vastitatis]MCI0755484.1 MFS transporter [Pseudoroseomonas vastitatis]
MDERWRALVVLAMARLSLGFQFQSIASVSTLLIEDLDLAYADLGFLIGLYVLPGVVLALPGGALGQRFGDKRVVMTGLALMAGGGILAGLAENYSTLIAGRLLSGVGGVLLNVLMAKMATDWFAGREIVLAMALFVNSFPVGIGLALLVLGMLTGGGAAWPVGPYVSATAAAAALLLLALAYRRHPNDRSGATSAAAGISGREIILVSLAGMMWGLYNGAFGIMLGFARSFWSVLASAWNRRHPRRYHHLAHGRLWPDWRPGCAALGASTSAPADRNPRLGQRNASAALLGTRLHAAGDRAADGPAGRCHHVASRSGAPTGKPRPRHGHLLHVAHMGQAGLPPAAGWLQDLSGNPAAPLYFAGGILLAIPLLYASFLLWNSKTQLQS